MSEELFQRYGAYYDLLYRDKDYDGEAKYIARTLRAVDPHIKTILELGSGTGRHGRLLAAHGFDVLGIERSEAMAAAAKRSSTDRMAANGGAFDCVQGDIRTRTVDRVFDAALSLFHVVSYQTRNPDLTRTFANAARHLRPKGTFFFDVWHGPAVVTERPSARVKTMEDEHTRLIRVAEPLMDLNAGTVTVQYTMLAESKADGRLTTFREEHPMRYLFPVEIEFFADQAGFEIERSEEFLTGHAPSDRTWGVAYLLRKRA
jgi:SAM-dependent methyltransferase